MGMVADERDVYSDLSASSEVSIRRNISGAKQTTMAVGGVLTAVAEPQSSEQVQALFRKAQELGVSCQLLGAGSNLLIPDSGVQSLVIRAGRGLRFYESLGAGRFRVGAAMSLMTLSRELSAAGYSGLEFAGGIPASVGGAVCMNAGAHGGEMSDVLQSVTCVLPGGSIVELSVAQLECRYRSSKLPVGSMVVSGVIQLKESDPESTARARQENLLERKKRQPLTQPSCGSVFKNPEKDKSAGWFIEQAGLKGERSGGAEISEMHANWIVNPRREASASDVASLIELCQKVVHEKYQVHLEPEMVRW